MDPDPANYYGSLRQTDTERYVSESGQLLRILAANWYSMDPDPAS